MFTTQYLVRVEASPVWRELGQAPPLQIGSYLFVPPGTMYHIAEIAWEASSAGWLQFIYLDLEGVETGTERFRR